MEQEKNHYDYSYRLDSRKVASCIDILKVSLNVKPGVTKNVKIAQHYFQNLSVNDSRGTWVHFLFDSYCNSLDVEDCVGIDPLFDVVKMINKIEET